MSVLTSLLFTISLFAADDFETAKNAVVKIDTTYQDFNYANPWEQPDLKRAGGTGFIIEGNRILTNAHVVSSAVSIRVQRTNQRTFYKARIEYIAHDCDLAILVVDDASFFKDSSVLKIGETPPLNSPVVVIGFPIGGDRVSITRGIVSRKDMDTYSHSQVDSHLTIQVDAAINPGNSGGPALQNGQVIGVAFQVYTRGENLGYLIPPEVIRKFLTDIVDGKYDGYIDFGVLEFPTTNATLRKALGIDKVAKNGETGVLVYSILPGSSVDGLLKDGDVILAMDGRSLSETGEVENQGELHHYSELIDNLASGTQLKLKILRDKQIKELSVTTKKSNLYDFQRKSYDKTPLYRVVGGLVFQPLDAELMGQYGRAWTQGQKVTLLYRYRFYAHHELYKETNRDVVFTRRLPDRINSDAEQYSECVVSSVNGNRILDFEDFSKKVDEAVEKQEFLVLSFKNNAVPLVIRSKDIQSASPGILKRYGIQSDRSLGGNR